MEPVLHLVAVYGYAAIFLLLVTGIVGLPVPDEWLMVFAGYLVYAGKLNGPGTFAAALAGSLCGITCSYWIGRRFGMPLIRSRWGRYLHLTDARIQLVHDWFERIGHWLLFVGYYIPGVRHFTAVLAGTGGLRYRPFALYAYCGATVWVSTFLFIGYHFGERWRAVLSVVEANLKLACVIAALVGAAWLAYHRGVIRRFLLGAFLLTGVTYGQSDWDEPFPPHRIANELYYVGSKGLSSYLITTAQGHILINSSFERTIPLIRASVEKLGFRFSDIKILLASHAHDDHMEGSALLKRLTGAQVYVMEQDVPVTESGGNGVYLYKNRWQGCKVDRVLKDGDTVKLGGAELVARLTPGHTRGCTTWTMKILDGTKPYDVVIVGSPNVNPGYQLVGNSEYPTIAKDYAKTFEVLRSLPCDIFLGAHGGYYGMEAKYAAMGKSAKTNSFVDPEGYKAFVAEREKAYRDTLASQSRK